MRLVAGDVIGCWNMLKYYWNGEDQWQVVSNLCAGSASKLGLGVSLVAQDTQFLGKSARSMYGNKEQQMVGKRLVLVISGNMLLVMYYE